MLDRVEWRSLFVWMSPRPFRGHSAQVHLFVKAAGNTVQENAVWGTAAKGAEGLSTPWAASTQRGHLFLICIRILYYLEEAPWGWKAERPECTWCFCFLGEGKCLLGRGWWGGLDYLHEEPRRWVSLCQKSRQPGAVTRAASLSFICVRERKAVRCPLHRVGKVHHREERFGAVSGCL